MAAATLSVFCDPCIDSGEEKEPEAFCLECRELYCKICFNCHRKQKATTSHQYVKVNGDEPGKPCPCESCDDNEIATSLCTECCELYCTVCTNCHRKFKATKHHVIVDVITQNFRTEHTALSSDLAACSLDFNATYSGAQVPIAKQQEGTSIDKKSKDTSVPFRDDNKTDNVNVTPTPMSATFHCDFSVLASDDKKNADINRMIAMSDGRVCVVGRHDYKIKLYSDDYVLCDELRAFGHRDITDIDNDTIALSFSSRTCDNIICYSVKGRKFTQTGRKLRIDGEVFDIAHRRGEFIVRYEKDQTDYTCCGSKLIVKQNRKLNLGDFLHYDLVSDCVFLGNFVEHTISCYTVEGQVRWRITLESGPKGIVVVRGVVLVAVHAGHPIHQITMDGRLLSDPLLTEDQGITMPHAITYQPKQHRLLIAKSYNDKVMVFNLSQ